ncbi:fimbrial biogenesis chaperone [Stenotrophomonas sepilia]
MNKLLRGLLLAAATMSALVAARSEASVVIGGTRMVYPAEEREITVKLTNEGDRPTLVQVWLDDGDERSTPDTAQVPFTVSPPIFRMDSEKGQAVRIVYTREPLPADRESLFWINVLEVPPKADNSDERNLLQFAFRTRIKLFYRPSGLAGDAATAPAKLSWKLVPGEGGQGVALQVSNPTAYHVNFAQVGLKFGERSIGGQGGGMVAPKATAVFPLKDVSRPVGGALAEFTVINDYGALNPLTAPLAL